MSGMDNAQQGWRGEMRNGNSKSWEQDKWGKGDIEKGEYKPFEYKRGERIPKKYLIWSQLQEAQDRVHNLYSEMTDYVELDVSTITDAEFGDAPLRMMHTAMNGMMLFFLGYIGVTLMILFGLPSEATLLSYFGYWILTLVFPLRVVRSTQKWVVGKRRTGRYYNVIKRIWASVTVSNLMLMLLFLATVYYNFAELQEKIDNYGGFAAKYVNRIEIAAIQESMLYGLYVTGLFYLFYFALSYWFLRKAKIKQRENKLKMEKHLMASGDVTHNILHGHH